MNEMIKMVVVTTIICAFSAVLLGGLKDGLKDRIEAQEDLYIRGPAVAAVLKDSPNNPLEDSKTITIGGEQVKIYPWIEEGKIRRLALERSGAGGYGGDVIVMVALDMEKGSVFGIEVTQHKETPGVGSRAMEASFLSRYLKLAMGEEISLKSDGGKIDALSGATRSSTAITDAVNQAVKLVSSNRDEILMQLKEGQ